MGKISKKDVVYIANLARLALSDEEMEKFTGQIGKILEYMDKLKSVDTSGVSPYSQMISSKNVWRDDIVAPCSCEENIVSNAPESETGYFKVNKIIE